MVDRVEADAGERNRQRSPRPPAPDTRGLRHHREATEQHSSEHRHHHRRNQQVAWDHRQPGETARQIRKYTKSKGAFTSENALLKLIYCACQKIMEKWNQPMHN